MFPEGRFLDHFRETLRINPRQEVAHHNLGAILRKQGVSKEAIDHLSEAARLKPDDSTFKNDLRGPRGARSLKGTLGPSAESLPICF